jgi:hypothetical protein
MLLLAGDRATTDHFFPAYHLPLQGIFSQGSPLTVALDRAYQGNERLSSVREQPRRHRDHGGRERTRMERRGPPGWPAHLERPASGARALYWAGRGGCGKAFKNLIRASEVHEALAQGRCPGKALDVVGEMRTHLADDHLLRAFGEGET